MQTTHLFMHISSNMQAKHVRPTNYFNNYLNNCMNTIPKLKNRTLTKLVCENLCQKFSKGEIY